MDNTYWCHNGRFQKEYEELWERLVPGQGPATTKAGEALRALSKLYYRWFNDGDRIEQNGPRPDSSAEDAWGFLHNAHDLLKGGEGKDALKAIGDLAVDAALARTEEAYEEALERLADAATLYAATRPLVATDEDFVGNGWDEVCEQECGLYDPDAEDEDECCEDDEE